MQTRFGHSVLCVIRCLRWFEFPACPQIDFFNFFRIGLGWVVTIYATIITVQSLWGWYVWLAGRISTSSMLRRYVILQACGCGFKTFWGGCAHLRAVDGRVFHPVARASCDLRSARPSAVPRAMSQPSSNPGDVKMLPGGTALAVRHDSDHAHALRRASSFRICPRMSWSISPRSLASIRRDYQHPPASRRRNPRTAADDRGDGSRRDARCGPLGTPAGRGQCVQGTAGDGDRAHPARCVSRPIAARA